MGTSSAQDKYYSALDQLLRFQPAIEMQLDDLINDEPHFVPGYLAKAYLGVLTSEPAPSATALTVITKLDQQVPQEKLPQDDALHREAICQWAKGHFRDAQYTLDQLLLAYPKDMLGIFCGHQLDFFLGDKGRLRDRLARSLPEWAETDSWAAFIRGMLAFGLEENCSYAAAERQGYLALQQHSDDVWALHAVVHVYEMRGESERGLQVMGEYAEHWEEGNFLNVHNFWHKALYLIELQEYDAAINIYDTHLHNNRSQGVALEMLDAASFLWRLLLEGKDEHERFSVLADAWTAWLGEGGTEQPGFARGAGGSFYAFNDYHSVMALVGAGRLEEAKRKVAYFEDYVNKEDNQSLTNVAVMRGAGLPVARALVAFGEGKYDRVVEELLPVRYELAICGGSDAQRDAIQRMLLEAATRAKQHLLARALANEKVTLRNGRYDQRVRLGVRKTIIS